MRQLSLICICLWLLCTGWAIAMRIKSSWGLKTIHLSKVVSATAQLFLGAALVMQPLSSDAFGPQPFDLMITSYKQVELCNGKKPIMPGQKAAEGLYPVCIEVDADIANAESSKVFKDVAVYGFVKEDEAGNSVLPNNPDFNTDAGQYAMITEIRPGDKHVSYQFVAAVSANPNTNPIPKLSFLKTKAISYPGGEVQAAGRMRNRSESTWMRRR